MNLYPARSAYLLAVLEDVQAEFGCVPDGAIAPLATHFRRSEREVHDFLAGLAIFRRQPLASHVLRICQGPICVASGSRNLAEAARKTGRDRGDVSLVSCHCLGICHQAPAAKLDETLLSKATPERISEALHRL